MQHQHKAYRAFRITVIALCIMISVAAIAVSDAPTVPWAKLLFLIAIATLCEFTPVAFGSSAEVSLILPLIMMTMLVYGPLSVVILGSSAFIFASVLGWTSAVLSNRYATLSSNRHRLIYWLHFLLFKKVLAWIGRSWEGRPTFTFKWMISMVLYNTCQYCLNSAIASLVYFLAGGFLLNQYNSVNLSSLAWARTVGAAVLAMTAFFLMDAAVYDVHTVLYENVPAYRTWSGLLLRWKMLFRQTIASMVRSDIILGALGGVLTYLYIKIDWPAIIALFGSLYMIRDAVKQTFGQIQSYRDTVTTLGTYMQRYHPYTRGHLKRVADLSERLAKELGLPLESVMMMPDAGMLHDIGKVGVSEDILDKIGKLSDEEWAIIKSHPVKGAEIVSHLPFLDKIVDWVKYHHKWADGSGYPDDGRKDGEIPVEASIIAVADAFDAMTDDRDQSVDWVCDACGYTPENGDRPDQCPNCGMPKKRVYREPLSLDEAIDQLRRGAGSQFSPPVVKAFLRMVERDGVHMNA